MRPFLWLLLPLAMAGANPAAGQDSEGEVQDQTVCIGTPQWRATLSETIAIEAAPVPTAFRTLYESQEPCLERRYNALLLAEWHLRFGSARTFGAALAYAERGLLQQDPAPAPFRAAVQRAWRAGQAEIRRGEEPPRLDALMESRGRYIFLATQYLRAAEEFGDLALLDRADPYLRAADAARQILEPARALPALRAIYSNLHVFLADDLEMRAAILRAALTRAPAEIAAAEAVLRAKDRPFYRRLAENAFSTGENFCHSSEDARDPEDEADQACRDDPRTLQARVINHLLSRAMLDIVTDRENIGHGNDEAVLRLLELERIPDRHRCCQRDPVDDIVRLRLARAAYFSRILVARGSRTGSYGDVWDRALTDLQSAEQLIRPHEAPTRARRIARAWLSLFEQGERLFPRDDYDEVDRPINAPARQRYASYLRHLLAGLDAIAAGLPPRAN